MGINELTPEEEAAALKVEQSIRELRADSSARTFAERMAKRSLEAVNHKTWKAKQ